MKWISVKEELPKFNEYVLVFGKYNNSLSDFQVAALILPEEGYWQDGKGQECGFVTHWMPLPAPPVKE